MVAGLPSGSPSFFKNPKMGVMRTYFYIDGFNFYYGCLKNSPYKWLDLQAFCQTLIDPTDAISKIRYFTAYVKPTPTDPEQNNRQKIYINALKTHVPQTLLEFHYGHFSRNKKLAQLVRPTLWGRTTAQIYKTEEKGSDVNLATHLLNDAWLDAYDRAVIVSNDSDLEEAMKLVKLHHPAKHIWLVSPDKKTVANRLKKHANHVSSVRPNNLSRSQLPSPIPGSHYFKPPNW